ncbi:M28 family peptidase [Petrachloros mirabilis]
MKLFATIAISASLFISLATFTFANSSINGSASNGNWLTTGLEHISEDRMLADIKTLSSPTYQGRQTGSPQDKESAAFIAARFGELELQRPFATSPQSRDNPFPQQGWEQGTAVTTTTIGNDASLTLFLPDRQQPLHRGTGFLPVLDSPSADIRTAITFVGYGLSDPSHNIDDYAGVDVRDKIVLFLRGKPEQYSGPVSHADKVRLAKQHGAAAYLTATGPILTPYEQRRGVTGSPGAFYSTTETVDQLPGAWVSTSAAEAILDNGKEGAQTLRGLQEEINRTGSSHSIETNATAHLQWTSLVEPGTLFNVLSMIRGYSPDHDQAVVIGAHRDHFGEQAGLLFAGADDNASGTAVLLEVARVLALAPATPKRSILFISFSGEEQGLLGSRLYVAHPIIPLTKTIGMINVDHAGVGNGRLTVGATGFEKTIAQEIGQLAGLSDKLDVYGYFPGGDHVPFKEAGVPTITVVSGGIHPHFHRPTDTVDTIDRQILRSVAQYVLALAWQLANAP